MSVQRTVAKGLIGGEVSIRSMFTADVVTSGGDTSQVLWNTYMSMFMGDLEYLLSPAVEYSSYEIQIPVAGSWELFDEITLSTQGGAIGDQLANAVSLVLIGKAPGLRHMGRKFIGALTEELVIGNHLNPTYATYAASLLLDYISPVNGIGGGVLTPGVVDGSGNFHGFTGGVVSSILGSMRRRKPGVGY